MADNRDSRTLRKDAPVFAEDDPLAELARMFGDDSTPQGARPQERAEPEFTFDLEAELLAQLDPGPDFRQDAADVDDRGAALEPVSVEYPEPARPAPDLSPPVQSYVDDDAAPVLAAQDDGDLTDLPMVDRRPIMPRDDSSASTQWSDAATEEPEILFALDEADLADVDSADVDLADLDLADAVEEGPASADDPIAPLPMHTENAVASHPPVERAMPDLEEELEQAFLELQRPRAAAAEPRIDPILEMDPAIESRPVEEFPDAALPRLEDLEIVQAQEDGAEEELADLMSEAAFAQDSDVIAQSVPQTDQPSIEPYWNESAQGIDLPDMFVEEPATAQIEPSLTAPDMLLAPDILAPEDVEAQEPLDIAFDFDDLALELEAEADADADTGANDPAADPVSAATDHAANLPLEPVRRDAPPVASVVAPLVAPAVVPVFTSQTAYARPAEPRFELRETMVVDDGAFGMSRSAKEREFDDRADADIAFDRGEIADTGSFIEPVGEIEVPDLPDFDEPPVIAHESELEFDLETEFNAMREQELAEHDEREAEASTPAQDALAPIDPPIAAAAFTTPSKAVATDSGSRRSVDIEDIDFSTFDFSTGEGFRQAGNAGAAYRPQAADDLSFDDFENAVPQPRARSRSNRTLLLAGIGLVVMMGGGALAWGLLGGSGTGSEPLIIAADTDPIKVVPSDPGGRTVPNQNIAVYEQVDGSASPQTPMLMTRSEEPVDVVQRTLDPSVLPFEQVLMTAPDNSEYADEDAGLSGAFDETLGGEAGRTDAALADGADTIEGLIAPVQGSRPAEQESVAVAARRVQTMVVRADGTLVPRVAEAVPQLDGTGLETAAVDAASGVDDTQPAVAATTGTVPVPVRRPGEAVAERLAPSAQTPEAQPSAATAQLAAPVRTVQTTTTTAAPPTGSPTVPPPPAQAPAETAAVTPAAASPDTYYIQISSQPTQESAQASYQSLSQRHAGIIGGRAVQIQPAVIPDRGTFYRVRIAAGSRDEANALCQSYQTAGGSCFVAR